MMCNHQFRSVEGSFKGYEQCSKCGTYHSIAQESPFDLYVAKDYWDNGDGSTGRSTFKDQISNMLCTDDCGISKVDRVLQFIPNDIRNVLEIGCAPGVLLNKLSERGVQTFGIEPNDKHMIEVLFQSKNSTILKGLFPQATKQYFPESLDCIVGMDVFEHVEDYVGFLDEVERLLRGNGVCVLMSPIILEDNLLRDRDMQHPDEHCWIWTQKALEPYLKSRFIDVKFSRWIVGHEIITFRKP